MGWAFVFAFAFFAAFILISLLFHGNMLSILQGIFNLSTTVNFFSPFLMCCKCQGFALFHAHYDAKHKNGSVCNTWAPQCRTDKWADCLFLESLNWGKQKERKHGVVSRWMVWNAICLSKVFSIPSHRPWTFSLLYDMENFRCHTFTWSF